VSQPCAADRCDFVDVLLLGAELVGVSALALTAVGGTGRQTRVAFAAVDCVLVFHRDLLCGGEPLELETSRSGAFRRAKFVGDVPNLLVAVELGRQL